MTGGERGAEGRVDIEQVAEFGLRAPVSIKSITGHTPMMELRNAGYRTFFVVDRQEMWVLHCWTSVEPEYEVDGI